MATTSGELEQLVARAAQGDGPAQQELLTRYWPLITAAVRGRKSRLGRKFAVREQTVDIMQDTAMRILQNLGAHQFRSTKAFAGWVRKLAESQVVDSYRKHRSDKRDMGADTGLTGAVDVARLTAGMETRVDNARQMDALLRQMETLKPEYAAALLMFHMGFSHGEIGHTLGCSAEGARKLVSRAHRRLVEVRLAAASPANGTQVRTRKSASAK